MAIETQSYFDALDNFTRLKVMAAARLKRRLDDGTISQADYDSRLSQIMNLAGITDPQSEAYAAFQAAVLMEAAKLPSTVKNAVSDVTSWVGETVGGAVSGVGGGFFKGLGIGGTLAFVAVGAGVLVVGYWAFTNGPLRDLKINFIPI